MALHMFLGAGAGVGALVGAGAGYFLHQQKHLTKKGAAVLPNAANKAPEALTSTPSKPKTTTKGKVAQELFGVQVTNLTTSSEFYTMLVRFETYLQFKEEREMFKFAVEHVDNLLAMDALLHGRNPVARAALPNLAETARRKVIRALNDIIDFSNEERPSPTKKENMTTIKDEINNELLAIVKDMNRALAAQPITLK